MSSNGRPEDGRLRQALLGAAVVCLAVLPIGGVAALRSVSLATATVLALVFVHLRFADHVPAAADAAAAMVGLGAATARFFGLTSLVQGYYDPVRRRLGCPIRCKAGSR